MINSDLIVNGVLLPSPVSIDYSLEDVDADSKRDVKKAKMNRNRIRKDVVKLSIVYSINSLEEVSLVLNTIESTSFNVEYYDLKEGKRITKEMYAGAKNFRPINVGGHWIQGFKFSFTEV